jgi:SNF2 family DNA or RNA helicase
MPATLPTTRATTFAATTASATATSKPCVVLSGHRCLLFSSTTAMLSIIEVVLRRHGFSYLLMDGTTPVAKRPALIEVSK